MKTLKYLLAAGLMMVSVTAGLAQLVPTPVLFPINSMFGGRAYGKAITVTAVNMLFNDGYNLYAGTYTVVPSTGTNPIVYLEPNSYLLTVGGVMAPVRFTIYASDGTNLVNVVNRFTSGSLFYFGTNGFASLIPGQNVTFVTNGDGSITMSASGGLMNGPGGAYDGSLLTNVSAAALPASVVLNGSAPSFTSISPSGGNMNVSLNGGSLTSGSGTMNPSGYSIGGQSVTPTQFQGNGAGLTGVNAATAATASTAAIATNAAAGGDISTNFAVVNTFIGNVAITNVVVQNRLQWYANDLNNGGVFNKEVDAGMFEAWLNPQQNLSFFGRNLIQSNALGYDWRGINCSNSLVTITNLPPITNWTIAMTIQMKSKLVNQAGQWAGFLGGMYNTNLSSGTSTVIQQGFQQPAQGGNFFWPDGFDFGYIETNGVIDKYLVQNSGGTMACWDALCLDGSYQPQFLNPGGQIDTWYVDDVRISLVWGMDGFGNMTAFVNGTQVWFGKNVFAGSTNSTTFTTPHPPLNVPMTIVRFGTDYTNLAFNAGIVIDDFAVFSNCSPAQVAGPYQKASRELYPPTTDTFVGGDSKTVDFLCLWNDSWPYFYNVANGSKENLVIFAQAGMYEGNLLSQSATNYIRNAMGGATCVTKVKYLDPMGINDICNSAGESADALLGLNYTNDINCRNLGWQYYKFTIAYNGTNFDKFSTNAVAKYYNDILIRNAYRFSGGVINVGEAVSSIDMNNPLISNPAFTGISLGLHWTGVKGTNISLAVADAASNPFYSAKGHGMTYEETNNVITFNNAGLAEDEVNDTITVGWNTGTIVLPTNTLPNVPYSYSGRANITNLTVTGTVSIGATPAAYTNNQVLAWVATDTQGTMRRVQ